jgi:hypothetical protein
MLAFTFLDFSIVRHRSSDPLSKPLFFSATSERGQPCGSHVLTGTKAKLSRRTETLGFDASSVLQKGPMLSDTFRYVPTEISYVAVVHSVCLMG